MTCNIQRIFFLNKGSPSTSSKAIYKSILQVIMTWARRLMHISTLRYTLKTGCTWSSNNKNLFQRIWKKSKFQTCWENVHIRSVSFMEPIVALNQITQQRHKKNLSFVKIKGPLIRQKLSFVLKVESVTHR